MKKKILTLFIITYITGLLFAGSVIAEPETISQNKLGTLTGRVINSATQAPINLASIQLMQTSYGAISDSSGYFEIENIPVGSYQLEIKHIAFSSIIKPGIIVKPKRITQVKIELTESTYSDDDMVVTSGYFAQVEDQPVSVTNYSSEEIRRATGTGGDINRIVTGHPSIAKIEDEQNSLAVRGGSPSENAYYINGYEIGNINHFPIQGSSGGLYSMLHIEFVDNFNFYTGGYPAQYGNCMSSVMDIKLREGNRQEFNAQADINVGAISLFAEGPLPKHKGSWMLSGRRSSISTVFDLVDFDLEVPEFRDLAAVIDYDISEKIHLNFLNIYGHNFWDIYEHDAKLAGYNYFGEATINRFISGSSVRILWDENCYSSLNLSLNYNDYNQDWTRVRDYRSRLKRNSITREFIFSSLNHVKLTNNHKLDFGITTKYLSSSVDDHYGQFADPYGKTTDSLSIIGKKTASRYSAYLSHAWNPHPKLKLNSGLRLDYFSYNQNFHISPRFSLSYQLNRRASLNLASGIFTQTLPMVVLVQQDEFRNLKDTEAYHFVLGFRYLLNDNTMFLIEAYDKEYRYCPLNPALPDYSIIDQSVTDRLFFLNGELESKGNARSYGLEIMIQKKLADKFYGIISGSYFRSHFEDYDSDWHNRIYDNRYQATVELGYKPSKSWDLNLRWFYSGGKPYTPFLKRGYYYFGWIDTTRINAERLPDYRSFTIRIDRRFNFMGSNLALYLTIWNLFDAQKPISYIWSQGYNNDGFIPQWPRLVLFGVEFEF